MQRIRILGVAYAVLFLFVAVMGYIPAFVDPEGLLFGLFALDTYDNLLHAFSGAWALIAAAVSVRQTVAYFMIFGTVYFLDGVVGLFAGNAFLDFGIFRYGIAENGFLVNFLLNVPHILIGGFAMIVGYYLSRKPSFTQSVHA